MFFKVNTLHVLMVPNIFSPNFKGRATFSSLFHNIYSHFITKDQFFHFIK